MHTWTLWEAIQWPFNSFFECVSILYR